jgi:hypothetical protein
VKCHKVEHTCKFEKKTLDCELSEEDFELTSCGCKLTWTGECRSAATGCASLTKVPAVHTVHVTCARELPMHCVACKYTSLAGSHRAESDAIMPRSPRPPRASASATTRSPSSGHAHTTVPRGSSAPDTPATTPPAPSADTAKPGEPLPSPDTKPPAESSGTPGATNNSQPATPGSPAPPAEAPESKPASPEST